MGLTSTLLKAVAYVRAPKTALVVSHPVRGTAAIVAARALKRAAPPRLGTAILVLAGATALPFVIRAVRDARGGDGAAVRPMGPVAVATPDADRRSGAAFTAPGGPSPGVDAQSHLHAEEPDGAVA